MTKVKRINRTLFIVPKPACDMKGGLTIQVEGENHILDHVFDIKKKQQQYELPEDLMLKDIKDIYIGKDKVSRSWK